MDIGGGNCSLGFDIVLVMTKDRKQMHNCSVRKAKLQLMLGYE